MLLHHPPASSSTLIQNPPSIRMDNAEEAVSRRGNDVEPIRQFEDVIHVEAFRIRQKKRRFVQSLHDRQAVHLQPAMVRGFSLKRREIEGSDVKISTSSLRNSTKPGRSGSRGSSVEISSSAAKGSWNPTRSTDSPRVSTKRARTMRAGVGRSSSRGRDAARRAFRWFSYSRTTSRAGPYRPIRPSFSQRAFRQSVEI